MNKTGSVCLLLVALVITGCQSASDPDAPGLTKNPPPPPVLVLDLGDSVKLKLVLIPAGTFTMGSAPDVRDREPDEGPARKVTITRPFYMGVTEVTQAQYEAVIGSHPSRFKGPHRPVEGIWWFDAMGFCARLSKKTGRTIGLPTEAQWEYACRAGTTSRFGFGDSDDELPRYANFRRAWASPDARDNPEDRPVGTLDAGSLLPNRWGLYDMHGNVFEWCSDWYRPSYEGLSDTDPRGAPSGAYRVLRGGSWDSPPWQCRSAYRHRFSADGRFNHLIGFRVVADVP